MDKKNVILEIRVNFCILSNKYNLILWLEVDLTGIGAYYLMSDLFMYYFYWLCFKKIVDKGEYVS